jgi:hypothetical protein
LQSVSVRVHDVLRWATINGVYADHDLPIVTDLAIEAIYRDEQTDSFLKIIHNDKVCAKFKHGTSDIFCVASH